MKNTVSIIIPAYNAEKTIKRCVDSLIMQTVKPDEIIIVDDGSTDHTLSIIREYEMNNKEIIVITQKNSGPSSARNEGIDRASGSVLCFVDSDDFVEPNYVFEILKAFDTEKADVVFWGFKRLNSEQVLLTEKLLPPKNVKYYDNLIQLSESDMFGYSWIKAYKRSLIGKNRYKEDLDLFEDEIFTCNVLENECKVAYINDAIYDFVRDDNTLSTRTRADYYRYCEQVFLNWKELLRSAKNKYGENGLYDELIQKKANHFAMISKYYGLERVADYREYYRELSKCCFIKESTLNDDFIEKLRKGNLFSVIGLHLFYNWKNQFKRFLERA